MPRNELVFLGLLFVALIALVIWKAQPPGPMDEVDVSATPANADLTRGPAYLMDNQPWYFGPSTVPFLPTLTAGIQGQVTANPRSFLRRS